MRYTIHDQIAAARAAVAFWDGKAEAARKRGDWSNWDRCGVERRAAHERVLRLVMSADSEVTA